MYIFLTFVCQSTVVNKLATATALSQNLATTASPPALPPVCSCGKPLDPFGDHFFTCRKHPKSTLSNKIGDTLHTVLHTLGALAGFCRNNTDVQCEPTTILPHHPTKKPADIGFPPLSPASPSDPAITSRYIALDVTIPPPPSSAPALIPTQLPSPHPLLAAHNTSARQKFCGRTSQVDAALLVADLNANNITLLPYKLSTTSVASASSCTTSSSVLLHIFFHANLLPNHHGPNPMTFPILPPSLLSNDHFMLHVPFFPSHHASGVLKQRNPIALVPLVPQHLPANGLCNASPSIPP